jgi:hypothetical protein
MLIRNTKDLRKAVRMGSYTSMGGYPLFFVTGDSDTLHPACVKDNYRNISRAVRENEYSDWQVVAVDINYEDPSMYCAQCNKRIESAYAEDENEAEHPGVKSHDASTGTT